MAELVGLAASIIQIAGAGVTLSTTLYNFVGSATRADQEITDIAGDVEITANALDSVGKVFEDEDAQSVVSKKAIQHANSLIKRCEAVFGEIYEVIDKRRKTSKDGKKSLSALGKFSWPLKEQKVELLRRRLESLKNSLILLFHVLQLANGQARGKLEKNALEEEREKIRQLHQRQQDSVKSLEALERKLSKVSIDDDDTLYGSNPPSRVPTIDFVAIQSFSSEKNEKSQSNAKPNVAAATLTDDSETSDSEGMVTDEESEHLTLDELSQCAKHVQKLLKRIAALQQSFEATQSKGRLPKTRVHKLYKRFCQKFESEVSPRVVASSQSSLPLPAFILPSDIGAQMDPKIYPVDIAASVAPAKAPMQDRPLSLSHSPRPPNPRSNSKRQKVLHTLSTTSQHQSSQFNSGPRIGLPSDQLISDDQPPLSEEYSPSPDTQPFEREAQRAQHSRQSNQTISGMFELVPGASLAIPQFPLPSPNLVHDTVHAPPQQHHHHLRPSIPSLFPTWTDVSNHILHRDPPSVVGQEDMPPQASLHCDPERPFTPATDRLLIYLKEKKKYSWKRMDKLFPSRTLSSLQMRHEYLMKRPRDEGSVLQPDSQVAEVGQKEFEVSVEFPKDHAFKETATFNSSFDFSSSKNDADVLAQFDFDGFLHDSGADFASSFPRPPPFTVGQNVLSTDASVVYHSTSEPQPFPRDLAGSFDRLLDPQYGMPTETAPKEERPLFINPKQFHRILKRRLTRQRIEEGGKTAHLPSDTTKEDSKLEGIENEHDEGIPKFDAEYMNYAPEIKDSRLVQQTSREASSNKKRSSKSSQTSLVICYGCGKRSPAGSDSITICEDCIAGYKTSSAILENIALPALNAGNDVRVEENEDGESTSSPRTISPSSDVQSPSSPAPFQAERLHSETEGNSKTAYLPSDSKREDRNLEVSEYEHDSPATPPLLQAEQSQPGIEASGDHSEQISGQEKQKPGNNGLINLVCGKKPKRRTSEIVPNQKPELSKERLESMSFIPQYKSGEGTRSDGRWIPKTTFTNHIRQIQERAQAEYEKRMAKHEETKLQKDPDTLSAEKKIGEERTDQQVSTVPKTRPRSISLGRDLERKREREDEDEEEAEKHAEILATRKKPRQGEGITRYGLPSSDEEPRLLPPELEALSQPSDPPSQGLNSDISKHEGGVGYRRRKLVDFFGEIMPNLSNEPTTECGERTEGVRQEQREERARGRDAEKKTDIDPSDAPVDRLTSLDHAPSTEYSAFMLLEEPLPTTKMEWIPTTSAAGPAGYMEPEEPSLATKPEQIGTTSSAHEPVGQLSLSPFLGATYYSSVPSPIHTPTSPHAIGKPRKRSRGVHPDSGTDTDVDPRTTRISELERRRARLEDLKKRRRDRENAQQEAPIVAHSWSPVLGEPLRPTASLSQCRSASNECLGDESQVKEVAQNMLSERELGREERGTENVGTDNGDGKDIVDVLLEEWTMVSAY